jgi:MerR family mercuric resistance operon transcriptional regulator
METLPTRLAIGALSRRPGSRVETIRYYEHVGLLPRPPHSPGGYRQYAREHLDRLAFIRRARALGFSLDEVRRLLHLADERRRPCAEARAVASAHLADVRAKIVDLRRMERVLRETVARCEAGTGSECALIEALSSESGAARPIGARKSRTSNRTRGDSSTGPVASPRARRRPARQSTRPSGTHVL